VRILKRIAIIGLGSIGIGHVQRLTSYGVVKAWDVSAQRRNYASELLLPELSICESEEKLWDWDPEYVIVASPNDSHLGYARKAIQRTGVRRILVEKPVSNSVEETNDFQKDYPNDPPVFVVSNLRYHPGIDCIRRSIDKIGILYFARAEFGHFLPYMRPGQDYTKTYVVDPSQGGIIFDGIHEVDILLWMLGVAKKVCGRLRSCSKLEIQNDHVTATIEHQSNVISNLSIDYLQRRKIRGLELIGSHGTLRWRSEGKAPECCSVELLTKEGKNVLFDKELDPADCFEAMFKDFFSPTPSSRLSRLQEGKRAVELAAAINRSAAAEGRTIFLEERNG
jgi:predicted dehydrogenase